MLRFSSDSAVPGGEVWSKTVREPPSLGPRPQPYPPVNRGRIIKVKAFEKCFLTG